MSSGQAKPLNDKNHFIILTLILKCSILIKILFCVLLLLQTVRHGFPYQPTALAFDPVQKILAIGSRTGGVRMYPLTVYCSLPPLLLSGDTLENYTYMNT